VVSLSITEAEFIATALCACQCVWITSKKMAFYVSSETDIDEGDVERLEHITSVMQST